MRLVFSEASLHRIAQAVKPPPLPKEEVYNVDAEMEIAAGDVREIFRLLEQMREENSLTVEQIEDLEIQLWELQDQVKAIVEWGAQSVEWSNEMAQAMNDLGSRVDSTEAKPSSYSYVTESINEASDWWDNYLRENPYPYATL